MLARPQRASRTERYAELFYDVGGDEYYCLAPNCIAPKGRTVKMSPGFGNYFKHIALYHFGEITAQDVTAALQLRSASAP